MTQETTQIYLIGDQLTVTGFGLSGVKNSHVATPENITQVLDKIKDEAEVIAVTHSLYEHAEDKIRRLQSTGKIIARIPDRSGSGGEIITKLIREVIGFDMKK